MSKYSPNIKTGLKQETFLDREIVEDFYESPIDEIANKFLSGEITTEAARELALGCQNFTYRDKGTTHNFKPRIKTRYLENEATGTTLSYHIGDEGNLQIERVDSVQQSRGGFTALLPELESIARRKCLKEITLEVRGDNPDARKVYLGKGFQEKSRFYSDQEGSDMILMGRPVQN